MPATHDVGGARDHRHARLVRPRVDDEQRHARPVLDAQALVELLEQPRDDGDGQRELAAARCDQREPRVGRVRVREDDRGHAVGGDDRLERIEVAEQAVLVRVVDAAHDRVAGLARQRQRQRIGRVAAADDEDAVGRRLGQQRAERGEHGRRDAHGEQCVQRRETDAGRVPADAERDHRGGDREARERAAHAPRAGRRVALGDTCEQGGREPDQRRARSGVSSSSEMATIATTPAITGKAIADRKIRPMGSEAVSTPTGAAVRCAIRFGPPAELKKKSNLDETTADSRRFPWWYFPTQYADFQA